MFEFGFKMFVGRICKIRHISQTIYWIELIFYKEIKDTCKYIVITFYVKWSLGTYLFKESKLLDESSQIYQTRLLCTVWKISGETRGILLHFKLE
jgi:hypothetical protein